MAAHFLQSLTISSSNLFKFDDCMSYFWSSCYKSAKYFSNSYFFLLVISFLIRLRAYNKTEYIKTYLLLSLLRNFTFKTLRFNSLSQHRNFILVKGLDSVHHTFLLLFFLSLSLTELTLFLQKLVFLKIRSQFVDFLAKANLLSISFVH